MVPVVIGFAFGLDYFEKLEKSVQAEADFFAKHIAAHPVDWHMLQRIWLDD